MNTPAIPATLGKYRILRVVGRGATGVVYEALDPYIQRKIALKVFEKSQVATTESEAIFTRFRREAQAAGRLSHPKIVSIYDYGETERFAYIAMEFVQGRELKHYIEDTKSISWKNGIFVVLQILDGLDYSHAMGVIHRDIKPANILIAKGAKVKIADFGIAKMDTSQRTQMGAVLGTPAYMSPEQIAGKLVDQRSDLFSAGVILYQILAGKRPFSGNIFSIMHKIQNWDPPAPSTLANDLPLQFDALVAKALAKNPAARFQSATEFIAALKAAQHAVQPYPSAKTIRQDKAGSANSPAAAGRQQLIAAIANAGEQRTRRLSTALSRRAEEAEAEKEFRVERRQSLLAARHKKLS